MLGKRVILVLSILLLTVFIIGFVPGCEKSSDSPGYYIGNINTHVFHKPSCSYLPNPENRTRFDTRQEAIEADYSPCGHCNP